MSALWRNEGAVLAAMTATDIDAVVAIEIAVYPFPWTRGNFIDSLAAGYIAQLLRASAGAERLLGYFVAMAAADETHLLNITVTPAQQRQGHARFMMSELVARCRRSGSRRLWLEVRESNAAARHAYARLGFREMGIRPGYYPAPRATREGAVVMSLDLGVDRSAGDALD